MMASDIDEAMRRLNVRRRFSRYDLVLAVIPTAFLVAFLVSQLLAVPVHVVLMGATLVGGAALVDGLFVNPPTSGSGTA